MCKNACSLSAFELDAFLHALTTITKSAVALVQGSGRWRQEGCSALKMGGLICWEAGDDEVFERAVGDATVGERGASG